MSESSKTQVKMGIVGCGVVATAYYLPYMMRMPRPLRSRAVCDLYVKREPMPVYGVFLGPRKQYQDY